MRMSGKEAEEDGRQEREDRQDESGGGNSEVDDPYDGCAADDIDGIHVGFLLSLIHI